MAFNAEVFDYGQSVLSKKTRCFFRIFACNSSCIIREQRKQENEIQRQRDKEGIREEEEGEKRQTIEYRERTQSRVGPLPHPRFIVHLMEDGIPHCCLDISAKVLVEARAWAAVVAPDFQGFTDLEVLKNRSLPPLSFFDCRNYDHRFI